MDSLAVTIIGDGQMGLVLANLLAENGHTVRVWGPFDDHVAELAQTRHSPKHLPDLQLDDRVEVTTDSTRIGDATLIVNAIPTQFIREVWQRFADHVPAEAIIVSVSKGIENETLLPPIRIIEDVLAEAPSRSRASMVALSGPTIAAELAKQLPATMVAAAEEPSCAEQVQQTFSTSWLRVYTHDDFVGVEIAGATKNVIALAAGMVDGLEIGHNAKSALLARGLAEIARLGVAMGAKPETFFGVAGVGDLATTCFSPFGRNRTCGEQLGKGNSLEEILQSTASVVEGVPTTKSILQLAEKYKVDMPITEVVAAILFEGLDPKDAISELMGRDLKAERVGSTRSER